MLYIYIYIYINAWVSHMGNIHFFRFAHSHCFLQCAVVVSILCSCMPLPYKETHCLVRFCSNKQLNARCIGIIICVWKMKMCVEVAQWKNCFSFCCFVLLFSLSLHIEMYFYFIKWMYAVNGGAFHLFSTSFFFLFSASPFFHRTE